MRVNAQFETMFGYHREELLGESIEVLLPERFREQLVKHLTSYGTASRVRPISAGLKLFGKRKDGSEFPVDLMLSPLEGEEGSFYRRSRRRRDLHRGFAFQDGFTGVVRHLPVSQ